jgi:hypothetical protein
MAKLHLSPFLPRNERHPASLNAIGIRLLPFLIVQAEAGKLSNQFSKG